MGRKLLECPGIGLSRVKPAEYHPTSSQAELRIRNLLALQQDPIAATSGTMKAHA
jgi:hypothetical protein